MPRCLLALLVALGLLARFATTGSFAQDLDCVDFESREEAQAVYDADPSDPNDLDGDDNGIVCELTSSGGALYDIGEDSNQAAVLQQDTFGLTVGAVICGGDPRQDASVTCRAYGGLFVSVSLDSGAFIGSCIVEIVQTPNGEGSLCVVEGAPLNATLVVTADPNTIPAGYGLDENPVVIVVGNAIPGGGDGSVVNFRLIPVAAPEPPPDAGSEPEAQVSEGQPAAVHTGSCDNLGGMAAELADVTVSSGPPVGQRSAIAAATAWATVDLPLDSLLESDHAIAVHSADASDAAPLVCGDIGGADNDDGQLAIGLKEMNGSGFVGIAYLAVDPTNGARTGISIFLAEGLADDS